MTCQHDRTRRWKRSGGFTYKCLNCGSRRLSTVTYKNPTGFREFIPGMVSVDGDVIRTEIIDVTNNRQTPIETFGKWRRV